MPDSRHLDLVVNQIHDNMDLANMLNPGHLDLVVSQVQDNDHPPLGTFKRMTILSWI